MSQLDGTGMKRLHRDWRRRTHRRLGLVLDTVANPYNLGSIIRTAAAERVDHLYLGAGIDPNHDKVNKTALGTSRYLTWSVHGSGPEAVAAAHADGFSVVAIELTSDATPLHDLNLDGDIAVVLGHEDRGCSPATIAAADAVGYIPQLGKVGSLNVATAAAIAMYEVRRREWAEP